MTATSDKAWLREQEQYAAQARRAMKTEWQAVEFRNGIKIVADAFGFVVARWDWAAHSSGDTLEDIQLHPANIALLEVVRHIVTVHNNEIGVK